MSDYNEAYYAERKVYWIERFRALERETNSTSKEDFDAFVNASEDFLNDD